MIKNYLKLAYRSLVKNKTFSLINIFGLALGLTCCILISMYLYKEFSYDRHQTNGERLYQLGTAGKIEGVETKSGSTPYPMAAVMAQEFPEVESFTRLAPAFEDDKTLLQYKEGNDVKSFYETDGFFADSTFFRLFTYNFKEGNAVDALNEPNSIVISSEIAKKIFGNEPALNKTLHVNSTTNGEYDFKVTGVFIPSTIPSHINARFFMSMKGGAMGQWVANLTDMVNNNLFYSYLLLKPGADRKKLEAKFPSFIERHAGEELKAGGRSKEQFLTSVKDIHLKGGERNVSPAGSLSYLYILISIAIVTLLIACVNFMNLSTARSSKRAVEIGVRKVLGAEKKSLVRQFLAEAILLAFISYLISLVLAIVLRPLFEQVSGKEYNFSTKESVVLASGFFAISIIAGLVAGTYPAFYLSAFKPIKVLKGRFNSSMSAITFRRVLVVFQFIIAVALIVASITIDNQMRFMRSKELGFQKDQQLVIPLRTTVAKQIYPSLKNELQNNSAITSTGGSLYYPGISNIMDWLLFKQGTPADNTKDVTLNFIDNSFLQTLGVQLIAGRLFSKDFPTDTANRIILNEKAVQAFGFKSAEDAIGKNIAASRGGNERLFPIIGVVKDFHFEGLQSEIKSYGFLTPPGVSYNYLVAHINKGAIQPALQSIRTAWNKLNPNEPLEYSFLDQDFQKNYEAEDRLATIITYFTIVAIFISCLGLFGLTTFTVEQRTKEIGIRKVLGASIPGIVGLLSKDFLKLVVLSFLIASPLAWYFIHKWLESFAYRAPFTVWIVIAGWAIALLIAFITISIQALRAALSNPVISLRAE